MKRWGAVHFGIFVANFVVNFVGNGGNSTKFATKFATKEFLGTGTFHQVPPDCAGQFPRSRSNQVVSMASRDLKQMQIPEKSGRFRTTSWTNILRARQKDFPEAKKALEKL